MTEFMIGKREQIAMCEEDTWAALGAKSMSANGFIVGKNVTITPDFSKNWQEILTAGVDSRDIDSMEKGPESYRFTLTFNPTSWKFIRYGAHGTVTNTSTGPTTHTFTAIDTVKSFTLEWAKRGGTDHVITLTGCIITNWALSFAKGLGATEGFVTVVAECLAKSAVAGSSTTTISADTDDAFQFRMAKLTYSGSEVVEVNNGEITCDNGIDENDARYCNSTLDQAIGEPIPKVRRYTCRFNINQKNDTYYDDWHDQVVVPSTNKLEIIRGTGPADDIVFTFTGLYLQAATSPTNIEGITNVDLVGTIKTVAIVARDALLDY
ncbi:MAG: hypothetical protein QQN41_00020 [Nitrosopumilus sp.]